MLQGFACHARGVELRDANGTRVHARVRSKRLHDVELRAKEGRLLVACSCPAQSMGLEVCKHAWAALLEVDRQGALEDLRVRRGSVVVEVATKEAAEPNAAAPQDEPAKAPTKSAKPPKESKSAREPAKTAMTAKTKSAKEPAKKASAKKRKARQ